jgi:hypothetical protein
MSRKRLFSGIALAFVLAACGDSGGDPLGPSSGGASFDAGPVAGGNRTDTTTIGTPAPTSAGPVAGGN